MYPASSRKSALKINSQTTEQHSQNTNIFFFWSLCSATAILENDLMLIFSIQGNLQLGTSSHEAKPKAYGYFVAFKRS